MTERQITLDRWGEVEVDYDQLVREALGDWFNKADFGYYQGDFLYVFRDGSGVGYLVVGYGSCSGCDHLQDVVGYTDWERMTAEEQAKLRSDLDEMVRSFREHVRWFDSDAALVDSIWGIETNYWYRHEPDFRRVLERVLAGEEVDEDDSL